MKKLLILTTLFLSACISHEQSPSIKYYNLSADTSSEQSATLSKTAVKLMSTSVNPQFNTTNFVYRTGDNQYQTDSYLQFLTAPYQQIYQYLLNSLSSNDNFNLISSNSLDTASYTLQTDVDQFYIDYQDKRSPFVNVSMKVTLYKNNKGKFDPVATQSFTDHVDIPSNDPNNIVDAYDKALSDISAQLKTFVQTNLTTKS